MKSIRVAGCSLNQTPLDWAGNLQHILQAIDEARAQGVQVLCMPELAISGYGCEDAFYADFVIEQSLKSLAQIIPATEGIFVTVGLPYVYENTIYNCVAVMHNAELVGLVAKQALTAEGIHYEPRWFKPWPDNHIDEVEVAGFRIPLGDLIFEADGIRIGLEICEDAWNGKRPATDHYFANVDIILNPSASHFALGKSHVRNQLVAETTRSFYCAYVYSNLCGNEAGRVIYDGEILIAEGGHILARNKRFSHKPVQVLSTVVNLATARRNKKKAFSFQRVSPYNLIPTYGTFTDEIPLASASHRNPGDESIATELMPPIETREQEFYEAVCLGLYDYMRKSRSRGFVLSLSGGADSSACAVLAARAIEEARAELGDEAFFEQLAYLKLDDSRPLMEQLLLCVYQGTENSGDKTLESARELAQALGAGFHHWNIQAILDLYEQQTEQSIGRKLTWEHDDITLQNIQARSRAPGIWMMANLRNALLLATSNRSEAAVGYTTMDGDTAGGLSPVAGIDKATLIRWLAWAEQHLSLPALRYVNSLQPTAELRPAEMAQTDEGDLMPYPILDAIERCAIHQYKSPVETFRSLRGLVPDGTLVAYIKKFFRLWARNQWKRERYAPAFHLDDANLDPRTWCRFPILSGGYEAQLEELDEFVRGL